MHPRGFNLADLKLKLPAKNLESLKSTRETHVAFRFVGNGLAPTTNKYCDINATLTCSDSWDYYTFIVVSGVMDEKCNLQCSKWEIHNRMYRSVAVFNILPKISHNFPQHHYFGTLWKFCAYSIIYYWRGRKVWLRVQYLVMWYSKENLLHLCQSHLLKDQG